jgi:hypothetical protein
VEHVGPGHADPVLSNGGQDAAAAAAEGAPRPARPSSNSVSTVSSALWGNRDVQRFRQR